MIEGKKIIIQDQQAIICNIFGSFAQFKEYVSFMNRLTSDELAEFNHFSSKIAGLTDPQIQEYLQERKALKPAIYENLTEKLLLSGAQNRKSGIERSSKPQKAVLSQNKN